MFKTIRGCHFFRYMFKIRLDVLLFPSAMIISRHFQALSKSDCLDDALEWAENNQKQGYSISKDLGHHLVLECTKLGNLELGRRVQLLLVHDGLDSFAILANHLIRLFASGLSLIEASLAFNKLSRPDRYTWNSIVNAHAKHGEVNLAFHLYDRMHCHGGSPDKFTFLSILKACCSIGHIDHIRRIHEQIIDVGFQFDVVIGSSLVHMYAKCCNLEEAHEAFQRLPNKDVVAWGAMIAGFTQQDQGCLALECYANMQHEGIKPDKFTFSIVLKACAIVGAIDQGRCIHEEIVKSGLQCDVVVGSALVDMYAKCASLEEARKVFDTLQTYDMISWSTMISGYSQLGEAVMALTCFEDMQHYGHKPNDIVFTAILTAISRAGRMHDALRLFETMRACHGISQNISHINCMLDLLGHAGYIDEAEDLLEATVQPTIYLWMTLLSACRMHCNIKVGRRCFDKIVCLDSFCAAAYAIMADIYASVSMQIFPGQ